MVRKVIWKRSLVPGPNVVRLPIGSEVLYVQEQLGEPTIWFLFSQSQQEETEERLFNVCGTGQLIAMREKYLGTCMCGTEVWHVFDANPKH